MNKVEQKEYTILAIDTSCDETSVSVTRGLIALSNLLPSQIKYHKEFGGVVPSIAKLAHTQRIDNVVKKALEKANIEMKQVDAVAVTYGPGLSIALEVGIKKAKELAQEFKKPLVIINHMEGHLLSSLVQRNSNTKFNLEEINFPILGFLISGGHTELILMNGFGAYQKIGETLDDSCGEAYDKCGRILGFGYTAGHIISKFAKEHRKNITFKILKNNKSTNIHFKNIKTGIEYSLPIAMANSGDLNFSFSGLKTAFNNLVSEFKSDSNGLTKETIFDLCVGFEAAALQQLSIKLGDAIKMYNPKEVWLGGGVVASQRLRSVLRTKAKDFGVKTLRYPFSKKLTGDNAAMIGIAANLKLNRLGIQHNPVNGIYLNNFDAIDRDPSLSL